MTDYNKEQTMQGEGITTNEEGTGSAPITAAIDSVTIEDGREESNTEAPADLLTTISSIQEETNLFLSKWMEELRPSEEFELLCPARIDQLLQEANSVEHRLRQQKEQIREKLVTLSEILKTPKPVS